MTTNIKLSNILIIICGNHIYNELLPVTTFIIYHIFGDIVVSSYVVVWIPKILCLW